MNVWHGIVVWFGAGLAGFVVLVLPVIFVLQTAFGSSPALSVFAFVFGMLVGGFSPIVLLLCSRRVERWVFPR